MIPPSIETAVVDVTVIPMDREHAIPYQTVLVRDGLGSSRAGRRSGRWRLEGLGKPALVLQGENDLQVRPAEARALGSAHGDVRLVLLPDVNHTLKLASGETVAAQMAAYTDPSLPLAPSVVPTIAEWILAKVRPAKP